jgi:NAD(P)H-hydrate epimerase
MKIVTSAEMREIDRLSAERYGIATHTLMENAGTAVADYILEHYPHEQSIGVICGKGNNGGDGFVAARKLHDAGKIVSVLLLCDPLELRGDAADMFQRLPMPAMVAKDEGELSHAAVQTVFSSDLLVDAILGTGFRPPLSALVARSIELMWAAAASSENNSSKDGRPVVSIDIPSGADPDAETTDFNATPLIAPASAVVTFTAPRRVHVRERMLPCPIVVTKIGSPEAVVQSALNMYAITAADIEPIVGSRPLLSHKGSFGHVLVVGGSLGKSGAAAMSGIAALRAGTGLVTVATPRGVLQSVAGFAPELMTEPLPETSSGSIGLEALGRLEEMEENKSVVAVGPGITRDPESAEFVRLLAAKCKLPLVIDADGINAFEGKAEELHGRNRPLIITPHPGEMGRLTGLSVDAVQENRVKVARDFAMAHRAIVVLKGYHTLVADRDGAVWVNTTGNPGMATGGTGDILTGIIAGMVAQAVSGHKNSKGSVDATDHAQLLLYVLAAVFLHGLAGDLGRDQLGEHSLIATDLLKYLPAAFRAVRDRAHERFVRMN